MLVKPLILPADSPPPTLRGPIGVVIPAYNNENTIERCVSSLRQQQGVEIDLVVVDDASGDQTTARAEQAGARVIRRSVNGGPSAARNEGAKLVNGDFLFFAEADGWYEPDYLLTCLRAFADDHVGAGIAAGIRAWTERDNVVVRLGDAIWAAAHSLVFAGQRGTGAWCYRRDAFEKLGGFDENLRQGEDVDLARRLTENGWRTGICGWSTLHHKNPDTWRRWWRRAFLGSRRRGQSEAATPVNVIKQLGKVVILLAVPLSVLLALVHYWLWLLPAAVILLGLALESGEQRLALRYLYRRRDWRTVLAAPVLLWFRRLGFVCGGLAGVF